MNPKPSNYKPGALNLGETPTIASASDEADWLTPEAEFARWAKGGVDPGGKRLAVSASAVLMLLLGMAATTASNHNPKTPKLKTSNPKP